MFVDPAPFWEGAANHKLVFQYCLDTGQFQHFPKPVSIFTGSRNLEWREVSGNGTIYAAPCCACPAPGSTDACRPSWPLGAYAWRRPGAVRHHRARPHADRQLQEAKHVFVVDSLPRNSLGKVLQRTLRDAVPGEQWNGKAW